MMQESLVHSLDTLYAPQAWFWSHSPYITLTIAGLLLTGILAFAGFILARLGYKPLWALVLLVPGLNALAMWLLAYCRFPREIKK